MKIGKTKQKTESGFSVYVDNINVAMQLNHDVDIIYVVFRNNKKFIYEITSGEHDNGVKFCTYKPMYLEFRMSIIVRDDISDFEKARVSDNFLTYLDHKGRICSDFDVIWGHDFEFNTYDVEFTLKNCNDRPDFLFLDMNDHKISIR